LNKEQFHKLMVLEAQRDHLIGELLNDIIYLANRVKDLEDSLDDVIGHTLDVAIDFYLLRQELNRSGGNWIQVIFHPDCTNEEKNHILLRLKRIQPLKADRRLKELEDKYEGLMSNYTSYAFPILQKIEEQDKDKVDRQKEHTY